MMKTPLALAAALSLACAIPRTAGEPLSIPIAVSSNNKSSVDVYLLCGDRDAEWLGVVHSKETGLFEVPITRARCVHGLNFFLIPRGLQSGLLGWPLPAESRIQRPSDNREVRRVIDRTGRPRPALTRWQTAP